MSRVLDSASLEWQAVRPDVAHGVQGKTLLAGDVKVTLIRVAPGGKSSAHKDTHGHLFYFLGGEGLVWLGEKQFAARAGLVVRVAAGETHAYENTGTEDLLLISVNLPRGSTDNFDRSKLESRLSE